MSETRRPQIGDKCAFTDEHRPYAEGQIIDIRDGAAFVAVLGWPHMASVSLDSFVGLDERGLWRSTFGLMFPRAGRGCCHPRGYNAAGLCFDCGRTPEAPDAHP